MEIELLTKNIESSAQFKAWKKDNKGAYLAHFFIMYDQENQGQWQVGYYEPKKDRLATFRFEQSKVILDDNEEIFKKPDTKVPKLELAKIKIDHQKALDTAKEFQKEKYKQELPVKIIAILQKIPKVNNVWNITYVTQTLNTLNMKIDAVSGKVKEDKLTSLLRFGGM